MLLTPLKPLLTACAATLLLAACGGGGSQYQAFVPARLVFLGDELSVLTPDAKKYTVNFYNTTTNVIDCAAYPLWTQALATNYNMAYSQCNPNNLTNTAVQTQAALGAKVADIQTQVQGLAASRPVGAGDLVTVLVGMNDVREVYANFPTQDEAALTAAIQARGEALGEQVNALAGAGAKVLISTAPDIGFTPWALSENIAHTDTNRAELISRLVTAFNTAMRTKLLNDGSKIGLLLGDDLTRSIARVPSAYGVSNTTDAVCTVALPECTSVTLPVGVTSPSTYMWADALRPSVAVQYQLGLQAVSRTRTNPF